MGFLSGSSGLFLFLLRLTVGLILLAHGIPKILSIAGFAGHLVGMVGSPLKWVVAVIVIIVEVIGGLALVVGVKARLAAFASAILFLGIAFIVHMSNISLIFNLNPSDAQSAFEFPFLIAMASLLIASMGGGNYSKD